MENSDLLRRAEDLQRRCEKNGVLTATHFLTPAERFQLERWAKTQPGCRLVFSGGHPDCERTVGFFLPDWLDEEWLPLDEQICALELSAPFGNPGHRDYLGALLGMGIGRERLGDIWVKDGSAVVFCLPGVEKHLLSIDKVGRDAVRARPLPLTEVTPPERKVKKKSFSVQSLRLDAVAGGLFDLSRSEAARLIDDYFRSFPSIRAWIDATLASARANGYVETLLGRRRYVPDVNSGTATVRSFAERNAVNAPIQGTSAGGPKVAGVGPGHPHGAADPRRIAAGGA